MSGEEPLAWNIYPEPGGKGYYESDLADPKVVESLFDLCQILQAYITGKGWRFLIKTYGFSGLLEINRRSGWFDDENDREAIGEIRAHCLISGYDPNTDRFGEYDGETGVFRPH